MTGDDLRTLGGLLVRYRISLIPGERIVEHDGNELRTPIWYAKRGPHVSTDENALMAVEGLLRMSSIGRDEVRA